MSRARQVSQLIGAANAHIVATPASFSNTVTVAASGVTFNDASVQTTSASGFGFKNRIINGDMRIDQRGLANSVTITTTTGYTIDRWTTAVDASSKFAVQQVADAPPNFNYSLKATSLSAYTPASSEEFRVGQCIEGYNFADMGFGTSAAKPFTISFWVKSSLTGTFGVYVSNSDNSRTYVTTYAISAANTWEQKIITVAGDVSGSWATTTGRGIQIFFQLGAGSNYYTSTTNTWTSTSTVRTTSSQTQLISTNNATWQVTGVQAEKGSTATAFDYRDYGSELALCRRYYYSIIDGNSGVGYSAGGGFIVTSINASTLEFKCTFPVAMRLPPALVFNNPSGTAFGGNWYGPGSGTFGTTIGSTNVNVNGAMVAFTGATNSMTSSGGTVYGGAANLWVQTQNATNALAFTAEL
jgi:uncharacterized Zn-binding protein involved in type VI secretion